MRFRGLKYRTQCDELELNGGDGGWLEIRIRDLLLGEMLLFPCRKRQARALGKRLLEWAKGKKIKSIEWEE